MSVSLNQITVIVIDDDLKPVKKVGECLYMKKGDVYSLGVINHNRRSDARCTVYLDDRAVATCIVKTGLYGLVVDPKRTDSKLELVFMGKCELLIVFEFETRRHSRAWWWPFRSPPPKSTAIRLNVLEDDKF